MSSRDLFRAIGQIDDDLIESANKTPVKHTIPLQFRHFVPAAACFCLVLLGAAMVSQDRFAGFSFFKLHHLHLIIMQYLVLEHGICLYRFLLVLIILFYFLFLHHILSDFHLFQLLYGKEL